MSTSTQAVLEAIKKKQQEQDAIAKNPCKLCSMRGRKVCGCGGGGGGGSGGGGSSSDTSDEKDDKLTSSPAIKGNQSPVPVVDDYPIGEIFKDITPTLEPEDLESLLDKLAGLLTIERDDENGILTITSVRPFSSQEAGLLREYIQLIQAEFEAFKEELRKEGEDVEGYTATLSENSLVIRIPSVKNYDRFIAKLEAKHLLDLSGAKSATEDTPAEPEKGETHRYSPLATRPCPKGVIPQEK